MATDHQDEAATVDDPTARTPKPIAPAPAPVEPVDPDAARREQNELVRLLKSGQDRFGDKIPAVVGVVLLVGVAAAVVAYIAAGGNEANENAWRDYALANGADGYEEVASEHPESSAAAWATVAAGRDYLNQGIRNALTDRSKSVGDLKSAREAFEDALAMDLAPDLVTLQAQHGLAVATESLSDGSDESIEQAIGEYEQLQTMAQAIGNSRLEGLAGDRIAALRADRTKQLYAWLATENATPDERPDPLSGLLQTPGQVMDDGVGDISKTISGAAPEPDGTEADPVAKQGGGRSIEETSVEADMAERLNRGEDGTDGVSAAQDQE